MKTTRSILTTLTLILLCACGESSGGIQGVDTGTPQPITANLVAFNGATSAVAASPVAASPGIFPAPESAPASDGKWVVTPDQVKVTFTAITFDRPSGGETVTVGNCEVTFNFATASLSQALTCSIEVPAGTHDKIGFIAEETTQVLIDDATNGIYTDPNSATLLSTTVPAGGAQFVPLTNSLADPDGTFGGSFFLANSVEFSEGDNININIIGDLTHAVFVEVNNGTATFDVGLWAVQQAGIRVFVSLNDLGKINYYSGSATGLTYRKEAIFSNNESSVDIRIYYVADNQPTFLFLESGNVGSESCGGGSVPSQASAADASTSPADASGTRAGGYLGLDSNGVLGWARPQTLAWDVYVAIFAMNEAQSLGDTSTMQCQDTSTDPAPAGGSFSSGAPNITSPDAQVTLTLVAN